MCLGQNVWDGSIFRTIALSTHWGQILLLTVVAVQYAGKRTAIMVPLGCDGELCSWGSPEGLWGRSGAMVHGGLRQHQCCGGEPFSPFLPCSTPDWMQSTEDPFLLWASWVCQVTPLSPIKYQCRALHQDQSWAAKIFLTITFKLF